MVFKDFPAKTMGAQGNDAGIEIVLISCGKLFLKQVFVNPQDTGGAAKGPPRIKKKFSLEPNVRTRL